MSDFDTHTVNKHDRYHDQLRPGSCPACGGSGGKPQRVVRAGLIATCRNCGSLFRTPQPTEDELNGIYDEAYYHPWGVDRDETIAEQTKRTTFARLLERVEDLLPKTAESSPRLLDVGAATGLLLVEARRRGWEPHAVEINDYAVEVLRERIGPDRVHAGPLTTCEFPDGSFDAITMTDLLEHVLDIDAALTQARRLLRPGGVLCITTPDADSMSRRLMGRRWLHLKAEHVVCFSRQGVRIALDRSGFDAVRIGAHTKHLSVAYAAGQMRTFRHWLLTPVVCGLERLLPRSLARRPVGLRCGEMLVTARRPDETSPSQSEPIPTHKAASSRPD